MKLDTFDKVYAIIYGLMNSCVIGFMAQITFDYSAYTHKDLFVMFVIFIVFTKSKVTDIKIEYLQKNLNDLKNG